MDYREQYEQEKKKYEQLQERYQELDMKYEAALSEAKLATENLAKIKTENGIVMKIPFIELGMRSVYADSGEKVLK